MWKRMLLMHWKDHFQELCSMLVKYMVEGRLEYEWMTNAYVVESSVPNSSNFRFLREKTKKCDELMQWIGFGTKYVFISTIGNDGLNGR